MRYRMQAASKWITAVVSFLVSFLVIGSAWAQDVIKVGYLPQVHDAANFAVDRELGKKYKLEYVKFLRYADAEIALARGDIQMAPLGYATVVGSAIRDAEPKYFLVSGMSRGAQDLSRSWVRRWVMKAAWPPAKAAGAISPPSISSRISSSYCRPISEACGGKERKR